LKYPFFNTHYQKLYYKMIHLKITRKDTTIKGESKGLKGIKKNDP